jgi:ribonuclease D
MNRTFPVVQQQNDLSPEFDSAMRIEGVAAWDIETDGLDFRRDAIRTCQVYVPGAGVEIVRMPTDGAVPARLADALASERVFKVFHHAPFDLRFMRHNWGVRPRNVGCTKVLSKIVEPARESHSLAPLVRTYLGIELDKSVRLSDWSQELTPEQLSYAANDVLHLLDLYRYLWKEALNLGVAEFAEQSFAYLPVRVETDLRGSGDVFAY